MVKRKILVLHSAKREYQGFVEYVLGHTNIEIVELTYLELVAQIGIEDRLNVIAYRAVWGDVFRKLPIDQFSAVYHMGLSKLEFAIPNYADLDKLYVLQAWQAYLVYSLNMFRLAVNPVVHEQASASYFLFPRLFAIAKNAGLTVPKYSISTKKGELINRFSGESKLSRENLLEHTDFYAGSCFLDETIAVIDPFSGCPILVYFLGEKIYSYKQTSFGWHVFALPKHIQNKCLIVHKQCCLIVSELVLCWDGGRQYVFYALNPYPNWQKAVIDKSKLYSALLSIAYPDVIFKLRNKLQKTYIPSSLRPKL